jgi:glycogen(starch) synthase
LLTALGGLRVPMVVRLHSPAYLLHRINGVGAGWGRLDTALSERVERWLARRATLITSPSRTLAVDVARDWRLDPAAIRVIPNPVDADVFANADATVRDERTVLYVGRIEHRKGVQTLIDAIPAIRAACPAVRLSLVGQDHPSGPHGSSMREHLQKRLAATRVPDGAVEFTGALDRKALPALYRQARVCVVPSLYENFPYSCLEAMASGCAVIAAAAGGIPEIITDGLDGILVRPGDPAALAAALSGVLTSPSRARRLGAQARATVRARFDRVAVSAETARAYARLVARAPRRDGRVAREGERR